MPDAVKIYSEVFYLKKQTSEKRGRIKKQITSAGVYIALVALVFGITSNGVRNILGGKDGYEIPEIDLSDKEYDFIKLPQELPEQKNHDIPEDFFVPEKTVSETSENITAQIEESVAGTPDGVGSQVEEVAAPEIDTNVIPTVRVKPVDGYITREYSETELLYTPTMNDFRTHNGIDLAAEQGTGVCAFADGVIKEIYNDALMGVSVVIEHTGGLVSCYRNLSDDLARNTVVGNTVKVGELLGGVGESAIVESADVPHVHFELYLDGECVNPEEYFIG